MIENEYRKMRMILLFDLPSVEKEDIAASNKFVRNLKKIGFYMLQYSVYVKNVTNQSEYYRITNKVKSIVPKKGNIIIMKLTEKQYNDMVYLRGDKNQFEAIVGNNNLVFFGGDNDD